ncbi:Hypothetical protein ORPV_652 [Orpheovirus IHUMI-LCC2]|uniref:Uncharacterized protein n=1 Tax=Orpheovirus IHUMI-LCC2 TaxID=2023057 RepID=A0A2I2L4V5_9VIRU|nr:Hypothetical protein ORPV_652 [Orpheovirus IHUMI-LCC2]SNW62556.1 Hypothetical protein ORPV_652 [Orpheovirus IHUMI-LCC2]
MILYCNNYIIIEMEIVDNILYMTSFIKDCKTLLSISLINKEIYNTIRNNYYKRKIIEANIGNKYNKCTEYCLSVSFVKMIKVLQRIKPNVLLMAYVSIENKISSKLGNNIIVCDNVINLIEGLPKVMNVGDIDISRNRECNLVIGQLDVFENKSSRINGLLHYKMLKNSVSYVDELIISSNSKNYDNMLVYWIEYSYYPDRIELLYKDSYYHNDYPYSLYSIPRSIVKEEKLTINKVMSRDNICSENVDIGKMDEIIMNYLLCGIH